MVDKVNNDGIAYSDFGFGPTSPWGLVGLEELVIGADFEWFRTLEATFSDSFAAGDLEIWNVVKRDAAGNQEILVRNVTLKEGYRLADTFASPGSDERRYYAVNRRDYPADN